MKIGSKLERTFDTLWRQSQLMNGGMPDPVEEYYFHPKRKWRFDRAWPQYLVAVELEGGVWSEGRHVRPQGFEGDCEKYNTAATFGWRVLRFTGKMLKHNPEKCIQQIKICLIDQGFDYDSDERL